MRRRIEQEDLSNGSSKTETLESTHAKAPVAVLQQPEGTADDGVSELRHRQTSPSRLPELWALSRPTGRRAERRRIDSAPLYRLRWFEMSGV